MAGQGCGQSWRLSLKVEGVFRMWVRGLGAGIDFRPGPDEACMWFVENRGRCRG